MAKKKKDSRKINALSPKDKLKQHVIKKSVALKLNNYLLIVLFMQAFALLIALFYIGFVLKEREDFSRKRNAEFAYWGLVVAKHPNNPDVVFNYAKSAYESGKEEIAVENLRKALEIDPLFKNAQKLLGEIEK